MTSRGLGTSDSLLDRLAQGKVREGGMKERVEGKARRVSVRAGRGKDKEDRGTGWGREGVIRAGPLAFDQHISLGSLSRPATSPNNLIYFQFF